MFFILDWYAQNRYNNIIVIMDKKEHNSGYIHELAIISGQFPFKFPTSSLLAYKITCKFLQPSPALSMILKIHQSITHPMLTRIIQAQTQTQMNGSSCIVVEYENVELALEEWLESNINKNSSVWIQLQKLVIGLREVANSFVIKGVNVINAISINNIGVKLSNNNNNNNSSNISNSRQIMMPMFKIYIDLTKCTLIQKMADIAKHVIEADKAVYGKLAKQINQMAMKIEKQVSKSNYQYQYDRHCNNTNVSTSTNVNRRIGTVDDGSNSMANGKMSKSYCESVMHDETDVINNNNNNNNNNINNNNINTKRQQNNNGKISCMKVQQLQFSSMKTRRKRQVKQPQLGTNAANYNQTDNNNNNNLVNKPNKQTNNINDNNINDNINNSNNINNNLNIKSNGNGSHMYASQCNFDELSMQVSQAVDRSKRTLMDFRKYIKHT